MTTASDLVVDYHEGSAISPHFLSMKSKGIPIHGGYYIEDGRTAELGWWKSANAIRRLSFSKGRRASVKHALLGSSARGYAPTAQIRAR